MPKKSTRKQKSKPTPRQSGDPPARVVSDLVLCMTELAESVADRGAELRGGQLDIVKFRGQGGRTALTVLAKVPDMDDAVLSKLQSGETRFLWSEIAAISRAVADRARATRGPEQMAAMMTGLAIMESIQDAAEEAQKASEAGPPKQPKTDEVYQFKITLLNVEPAVWRRIQINDCTLADFHYLIQAAMGWENYHMYEFQVNRRRYVVPADEFGWDDDDTQDPNRVLVSELLPEGRKQLKFKYLYDFGDDWWHEVRFEKRIAPEAKVEYPVCLEGAGACPPEDCGGPWGYLDLAAAGGDKDHPNHEYAREWLGPDFDPKAFDPTEATKELRKSASYVEGEWDDDDDFDDDDDGDDDGDDGDDGDDK